MRSSQRRAAQASDAPAESIPPPAFAEAQRHFFALSPDLLAIAGSDGRFRWLSPGWEATLGYPVGMLRDRHCLDFVHPDDHAATRAEARALAASGHPVAFRNRYRRADGSFRWLDWNATRGDDGLIYAIARDVTARHRAEEARRESERRYHAVIAAIEEGIVVQDAEGRIISANPGVGRILGLATAGLLGRLATDAAWVAIREDGSPLAPDEQPARVALRTGRPQAAVAMGIRRPERPMVWLLVSARPLFRDGEAVPYGVVSSLVDITAHKRAEAELRRSEERARALLAEADRQARELALLDQVSTALAGELEPAALFRVVVEGIARAFGYTQVSLYLREGEDLVLQHQVGYDRVLARIPISSGISGRVVRTGEPVLLEDVRTDPAFLGAIDGITSEVCVPLIVGADVVGMLNVESTGGVALGPADLRLMQALAMHIGIAIGRARLYTALHESERDYRLLLDQAADGIFISDASGRYLTVNARACALSGYSRDELLARGVAELIVPDDLGGIIGRWGELHADPAAIVVVERRLRRKDGSLIPVEVSARLLPDGRLQEIARDITERKRSESELRRRAFHDHLTGLPNRALLADRLKQAVARAQRRADSRYAVLVLDLDRFKQINDSLGHPAGDALLIEIARRLAEVVREADTVARLGGDEFAILLDELAPDDAIETVARLHRAIDRPVTLGEHEIAVSASIGVVLGASRYGAPDELLRDADTALYRAKAQGRARHVLFDTAMHTQAVAQLRLENDLRRALERGEFVLHYQPIVTLDAGRLLGFEALVRWRHPRRGLVPPAEFIPAAEETGLIVPIGRWALEEACRQLAAWCRRLPADPPLTISVNVSARQFALPDLAEHVAGALALARLPAHRLRLELTEGTLVEQSAVAAATLTGLRTLGVQIQIDDFGTGYSSLGYLQRFPLDALKIDRSFTGGLQAGTEARAIVRAVVSLAQALNLQVIAEGVETARQRAELLALGCLCGQGYAFAPPLPADEALAYATRAAGAALALAT